MHRHTHTHTHTHTVMANQNRQETPIAIPVVPKRNLAAAPKHSFFLKVAQEAHCMEASLTATFDNMYDGRPAHFKENPPIHVLQVFLMHVDSSRSATAVAGTVRLLLWALLSDALRCICFTKTSSKTQADKETKYITNIIKL